MKTTLLVILFLISVFISPINIYAANGIRNPVLPDDLGNIQTGNLTAQNTGASKAIAIILARFFSASLALGSVIMMVYFVISAFKWLTASDSNTVSTARQGILNAVIGMTVLASIFAIANLVSPLLGLSSGTCRFPTQICWPTF